MNTRSATDHPAAQWAIEASLNAEQVDCTTAVVLKILDNKCKMLPGEMNAILAIYDVVHHISSPLLGSAVHEVIRAMRTHASNEVRASIRQLRIQAETEIPKPVMKRYKAFLRDGLFG